MKGIAKLKPICSLLILNFILFFIASPRLTQVTADLPFGIQESDYARYSQEFSTGETHILDWIITSLDSSIAEIRILSHGIRFNQTSMTFSITSGGGIMTINVDSWKIQKFTFLNGTEMPEQHIGYKVPFWIPIPITTTTQINTLYDLNVTPTLTSPMEFECLPTPRICWMTNNHYSPNNQMQRYYDATTGIVLQILTYIEILNNEISVVETLNDTNIPILLQEPVLTPPFLEIGFWIIALTLVGVTILIIRDKKRSQSTNSELLECSMVECNLEPLISER